ncbi:bifunctional ADP-dependent NAD(P)H-hydrate dehydratase/NAD(P)H-hydrate epimerase [Rhodothermus profundi]|uniref:Bifunctional NAD(P)H-hydrate repair enzyme n=1 Tax=Rhodothermus profundi TaxID=633813 RepID=A0A1M6XPP4_9BACT|nr:bifunctional ADP-dependent NAD(P)H-hydrate dehydratase/NAD(P)H-hydrate epimerase [Rhodothermus profundi]SHL07924.1 NAD(P)H-hydrate epimerase [Rhodothermus profundi]
MNPLLEAHPEPVLTARAMREADRQTIETLGLPGRVLMETAGRGAAEVAARMLGTVAARTVVCLCGRGNNGGDGFVLARVLHARGAHVHVVTLADASAMSDDAAANYRLLEHLAEADPAHRLHLHRLTDLAELDHLPRADLYVDALLGTGLSSPLRAPIRELVQWLNEHPAPILAIDIPTGLDSDTGQVLGAAVAATRTVTMGALKVGLLLGEGPRLCGTVDVIDIGIPRHVLEQAARQPGCAWRASDALIRQWLPRRAHDAHKYSAGLALIVAGSREFTGAPVMAATAAARIGAGYVLCACPSDVRPVLATKLTEVALLGLPETERGGIDQEDAFDVLDGWLERARALLVGPGLGRHPDTQRFARTLLERTSLPAVIDADGLNALVGFTELIPRHAQGRWILTPHLGEFRRLAGDVDLTHRIKVVQEYAQQWHCVLLLKGMPSVVGWPDGTVWINATGNPALATAGTGDVLAGLCVGLLAQGLPPTQAAVCALHVGGAVADHYAAHYGTATMMASDLLTYLPAVLRTRFDR